MSETGLQCHGCGSSNVTFDPQRRTLVCNQCGKEEFYSRATLNASGKVVNGKQNAIDFFSKGNYDLSVKFAREVIGIAVDNAPALYILAYYDDFVQGKAGAVAAFFRAIADTPLEFDEVIDLMKLFLSAPYQLLEYEPEVIRTIAANLQSDQDKPTLCDFFDKLCPYLISRRPSMSYLTKELLENYAELSAHCGIPKTCFALLKSIQTNPDSPYADNTFFLEAKTRFFFNNYVRPIQTILDAMADHPMKAKFISAYAQTKSKYEHDAAQA